MHNPLEIFTRWFKEATLTPFISDASAMTLATADRHGFPSVRVVLLKGYDERGFTFFTNMESRKSLELKENPHAALCFYWQPLGRQVRIEGMAQQVSNEEADIYYNSRPLVSRIGALVSEQSRPLDSHVALLKQVEEAKSRYSETNPPKRPAHWSGWRVFPERIEFWQEGKFRLHDRKLYTRTGSNWIVQTLYP